MPCLKIPLVKNQDLECRFFHKYRCSGYVYTAPISENFAPDNNPYRKVLPQQYASIVVTGLLLLGGLAIMFGMLADLISFSRQLSTRTL